MQRLQGVLLLPNAKELIGALDGALGLERGGRTPSVEPAHAAAMAALRRCCVGETQARPRASQIARVGNAGLPEAAKPPPSSPAGGRHTNEVPIADLQGAMRDWRLLLIA